MKGFFKTILAGIISFLGLYSCAYNYQEKEEIIVKPSPCDTTKNYVFADVSPIFNAKCKSCHEGSSPDLSDFASYQTYISGNRSKFETAIQFTGPHPMPQGGPKLPEADICTILTWIKQGTKP
jgi:hypothetical protein